MQLIDKGKVKVSHSLIGRGGSGSQRPTVSWAQLIKGGAHSYPFAGGWSGGAMALGNLPVPERPTILTTVGQGPIALAVGAGGGCLDIFTLIYPFSSFSLSLEDGLI